MNNRKQFAVLVDAENVHYNVFQCIVDEVNVRFGDCPIRRVYGKFDEEHCQLRKWKCIASDFSLDFCTTPARGSNDMTLAMDAMEILHSQEKVDGFVIVSSDCDFVSLAHKLRNAGKKVYCFGYKNSAMEYDDIDKFYDEYIFIEDITTKATTNISESGVVQKREVDFPDDLFARAYINAFVQSSQKKGGEFVHESFLMNELRLIEPEFNVKQYGCKKILELFESQKDKFRIMIQPSLYVALSPSYKMKLAQQIVPVDLMLQAFRLCLGNKGDERVRITDIAAQMYKIEPSFNTKMYGLTKSIDLFRARPDIFRVETEDSNCWIYLVKDKGPFPSSGSMTTKNTKTIGTIGVMKNRKTKVHGRHSVSRQT